MKKQDTFSLSITNLCKGIAICIMIYYHAFSGADLNLIHTVSPVIYNVLSPFGNVCVMFFVLLTGYGQGVTCMNTDQPYNRLVSERTVRLYSGYWPALILGAAAAPFLARHDADWSVFLGDNVYQTTGHVLANVFGITDFIYGGGQFILNQTWWYMSLALILVFCVPVMIWMWKKWKWGSLAVITAMTLFMPDLRYAAYFPGAMLGICLAGSDGFNRIHNLGKGILYYAVRIVLLSAAVMIWYCLRRHYIFILLGDTLFAYAVCQFAFDVLQRIPGLRHALIYLGKHSANMFYLHSFIIVYWPVTAEFVRQFRYDWLILGVVLSITLAMSIIIDSIKKYTGYNKLMDKLAEYVCS